MLTPYAPFFVLFCYVIETSSKDDLKLLQDFSATLELAQEASEATRKFAALIKVMCEVGTLYVEAKSKQQHDQTMVPIGDEFEMYLNQLGFMPGVEQSMAPTTDAPFSMPGTHQSAQIADWYSGSRNMMGLLEDDIPGMGMGMGMGMQQWPDQNAGQM